MIRINEIKLPVDHSGKDLADEICRRLRINYCDLQNFAIFKRSYDARKKENILFVYTVDAEVICEKLILDKITRYKNVKKTIHFSIRFKNNLFLKNETSFYQY